MYSGLWPYLTVWAPAWLCSCLYVCHECFWCMVLTSATVLQFPHCVHAHTLPCRRARNCHRPQVYPSQQRTVLFTGCCTHRTDTWHTLYAHVLYTLHCWGREAMWMQCTAQITITTHPLMIAVMQVLWHTCLGSCRTCSCWHRSGAHCPTCRHGRLTEEAGLCPWTSCTPWSVHEKHWSKKPANIYVHDYIHSHIILWWISIQPVLGWLDWSYTNKSEIPVYTNTNEFWILWIWLQALDNATIDTMLYYC